MELLRCRSWSSWDGGGKHGKGRRDHRNACPGSSMAQEWARFRQLRAALSFWAVIATTETNVATASALLLPLQFSGNQRRRQLVLLLWFRVGGEQQRDTVT